MRDRKNIGSWILCAAAALLLATAPLARPQSHATSTPAAQIPSEQDVADTQDQFLKLLRLSPVLTTVVARDPSLLADQQYVARNNPELAQFMAAHPDIAKNPDFYLFSRVDPRGGHREQALEREVWPEMAMGSNPYPTGGAYIVAERMIPMVVILGLAAGLIWLIRMASESRRWNRTFKQQGELHARLIDKFSSSQDLAAYLETEAGKGFLAGSPLAPQPGFAQQMPNAVARVLTSLQIGIVLSLLGIGLFSLRHLGGHDLINGVTVLGTLALMPGIGFILSAGTTWFLAHRLGLLPEKEDSSGLPPAQVNPPHQQ